MRTFSRPWLLLMLLAVAVLLVGFAADRLREAGRRVAVAETLTDGDPLLAPPLFRRYGCTGCHEIPGIAGADGKVGGSLAGLRDRVYIAGVANNSADNLVAWIVSPQRFSPRTAMPASGITSAEARHLAAYLYSR